MADCDDPTRGERFSRALIPVGCAAMAFLRRMRRPGAGATGFLVLATATLQGAKEKDWPKGWWTAGTGQLALIALSTLTSLCVFVVIFGYRRLLSRQNRTHQFATAADAAARLVDKKTSLKRDEIGVNIWLIKGMVGFRRLVREASVSERRHETPITWTKGKGIIGEAWERRKTRFADLDKVRKDFVNQEAWCSLPRKNRFRLSWEEFSETSRYRAVLAVPLHRHRFAGIPSAASWQSTY